MFFEESLVGNFTELPMEATLKDLLQKVPDALLDSIKLNFEVNWQSQDADNYVLSRFNSCTDYHKKQEIKVFKVRKETNVSIYDCLELFRQEHTLSKGNEWYCANCKQHVQGSKKMELYKVPEVLIFQLKRFKGQNFSAEKSFVKVNFPL